MGVFDPKLAPSLEALRAASILGHQMARREKRLLPDLGNAGLYADFSQFRTGHREHLEHSDLYRLWQDRLFNIAEREGKRFGLRLDDSMAAWDIWYNQIVQPLKRQLWIAWEAWHDLPGKYHEAMAKLQPAASSAAAEQAFPPGAVTPLRVAATVSADAAQMPMAPKAPPRPEAASNPQGIASGNSVQTTGESWSI